MWGGYGNYPGMMGYGYDGGWSWWMGLHGLLWLAFLILVVVAAVALIRYLWRQGGGGTGAGTSGRDAARAILDERYARGEIDRAEYLERKKDLG